MESFVKTPFTSNSIPGAWSDALADGVFLLSSHPLKNGGHRMVISSLSAPTRPSQSRLACPEVVLRSCLTTPISCWAGQLFYIHPIRANRYYLDDFNMARLFNRPAEQITAISFQSDWNAMAEMSVARL
ncbi:hypothetical protein J6590_037835 [Homalodisca vitripennis]|nr:hypothetical protein J6590_037835 [Homalodisca vitripennis]